MSQNFLRSLQRRHQHPHRINKVMPSDSSDRRATRPPQLGAPPPEPEHLPCPRCDSTNTKFCYYNNYNFSQPRHFCKSCRRYWTHGGTIRDIPVGGGSRKNAKRCRTTSSTTSPPSPSSAAGATPDHRHHVLTVHDETPVFLRLSAADQRGSVPFWDDDEPGGLNLDVCGSFTSLLSTDGSEAPVTGFGLGPFEDMGFSVGRAVWSFPWVGDGGAAGGTSTFGNTWQLDGGEGGLMSGGDCFTLPDLAISSWTS